MLSQPVIRVAKLGKSYQLGSIGATTLRESLSQALCGPRNRRPDHKDGSGEFWALRDISFDVVPGEVLGIIGRNGAGKSTLLKILSRITEPTLGEARIRGRVASLLEVGTGFHPELTGRENVYLNGAILGMRRREIDRKIGAITAFSGVEAFMDTPVKRYSSGMRVRLAFAVAAHLDPEILIIDEVLAVGDAAFQEKCLGKINEVARSGRTVLFVSHNMAAIQAFCTRVIVIDEGRISFDGPASEGVERYYRSFSSRETSGRYVREKPVVPETKAWIVMAACTDGDGCPNAETHSGETLNFDIIVHATTPLPGLQLGIGLENTRGVRVCTLHTKCEPTLKFNRPAGGYRLSCSVSGLVLASGRYHARIQLENGDEVVELLESALSFRVLATDFFTNGGKGLAGVVLAPQRWSIIPTVEGGFAPVPAFPETDTTTNGTSLTAHELALPR